ncbi:hypothetical protein [Streptomyces sp. NPDC052012]|uniref:hypothetical protein n=1 Tax=Streptomyces sp. NPDC052012 TaxID=3155051 RepID=UPI00344CE88B
MSDGTGGGASPADAVRRLGAEAAGMFMEVQRADTKATALCGVAGGLLAVDAAVLPSMPRSSWVPLTALACAAVFLGMALVAAMFALRPVLPRGGELKVFAWSAPCCSRPEEGVPGFPVMSVRECLRAEAERLALFKVLAQRKFRAVKWAVDLTTTALAVAGFGLLILYITA